MSKTFYMRSSNGLVSLIRKPSQAILEADSLSLRVLNPEESGTSGFLLDVRHWQNGSYSKSFVGFDCVEDYSGEYSYLLGRSLLHLTFLYVGSRTRSQVSLMSLTNTGALGLEKDNILKVLAGPVSSGKARFADQSEV